MLIVTFYENHSSATFINVLDVYSILNGNKQLKTTHIDKIKYIPIYLTTITSTLM